MTKDMVAKVNKIFKSDKPESLIAGVEPFVAILRNKMDANNVDVELFFRKYENLVAKMRRMEMRDMNEVVITEKAKLLEKVQKDWEVTQGNEDGDYS